MVLFLDLMLPDIDRVIFMDADQIVKSDLKELFNVELNDKPWAFVPHCNYHETFNKSPFWKEALSNNDKAYYFSGVFVLDVKEMRAKGYGNLLR